MVAVDRHTLMNFSCKFSISLVVVATMALACGSPPAAETPKPEPTSKATAEPEPSPPPPKCEALDEKCKADEDTKAAIPSSSFVFTPPKDWVYAQLDAVTIAQVDENGPVLALTTFKPEKNAFKLIKQRGTKLRELSEQVGVTIDKRTRVGRRHRTAKTDDVTLLYWQFCRSCPHRGGGKRADAPGALLLVAATLEEGVSLFGISYVPKGDDDAAGAIVTSLESLAPGEASEDSDDKEDNS